MITVRLAVVEGAQLAHVVRDFLALLGSGHDRTDPALARLAPAVYPDDDAASAAFAESTRADLLDRRRAEAESVLSRLASFDVALDALTEEQALAPRAVQIPAADIDGWLRTLTAVRLVLASRLGIVDEEDRDRTDPRQDVYDWLGYRLELLIESADRVTG